MKTIPRNSSELELMVLAVVALMLSLCSASRAEIAPPPAKASVAVQDFALLDHQGAFRHLYYYAKDPSTKAIVLFVQGDGCPLVRKRVPQLKRLNEAYASKGVVFWMINPNVQDSRCEVDKETT